MQRTVLITLIICMLVSHSSAQNTGQSDLSKQASKQDAAVGDEAKDAGDAEGDQKPSASRDRHEGITRNRRKGG